MNKYKVYGTYTATITKEVFANSEEEAREVAYVTFGGVTNFCGNGGTDYLVGVYNDDEDCEETIQADGDADFYQGEVEILEEDFVVDITDVDFTPADGMTEDEIDEIPTETYNCEVICTFDELKQKLIEELEESDDYQGCTINDISFEIVSRERTDF